MLLGQASKLWMKIVKIVADLEWELLPESHKTIRNVLIKYNSFLGARNDALFSLSVMRIISVNKCDLN